jgi:hypothetical protein
MSARRLEVGTLNDYTWQWLPGTRGPRLVGIPRRPLDPRSLVLRHVTLDEMAEAFGLGGEELEEDTTEPGATDQDAEDRR